MAFLDKFSRRLGVLEYLGTWNAESNSPALSSGSGQRGGYYVVSSTGATNLDNITDWVAGDWAVFNGSTWQKVDNTDSAGSGSVDDAIVNGVTTRAPSQNAVFDALSTKLSGVTVSEIDGTETITNSVSGVHTFRFDKDTGFQIADLGDGEAKISLGSSFKTWQVDGHDSLVAVGEDTVEFIAGSGISIETDPSSTPQSITIASTVDPSSVISATITNGDTSHAPSADAVYDALTGKENGIPAGSATQYFRGDKSWQILDKTAVGLANVPNTDATSRTNHTGTQTASTISDFDASAQSAVSASLAGKEPTISAGTTSQYWRGDKSWQTLDKSAVGLGNVPNTDATSRSNHTGTQLSTTISDFTEAAQDAIGASLTDSSTIAWTYTDAANTISAAVKDGSIGDAKLASGIDASKIGTGTVSNTEFGFLDGVSGSIQTAIDAKLPLAGGTLTGDLTFSSGKGDLTSGGLVAGKLINVQQFTTAGAATYTPTAGTRLIWIEMCGGGGGSGGCAAATSTTVTFSAGGGGAMTVLALVKITSPSATATVTIGAGGTAGTSTPGAGGNGGNSVFSMTDAVLTAKGGDGGATSGNAIPTSTGSSATGANVVYSYFAAGEGKYQSAATFATSPRLYYFDSRFSHCKSLWALKWASLNTQDTHYGGIIIADSAIGGGGISEANLKGCGASPAYNLGSTTARAGAAGASGACIIFEYA